MMHRAWSSIVEVPYCFSRSYVKFQGHTALKIVEFDPNWAFPDSNSSLNSPMAMKCCPKLETAKERCSIVFQGHPSNFKVTQDKISPILTQIGRFWTIGRSQLSNPQICLVFNWTLKFTLAPRGSLVFTMYPSVVWFKRLRILDMLELNVMLYLECIWATVIPHTVIRKGSNISSVSVVGVSWYAGNVASWFDCLFISAVRAVLPSR